MNARDAAACFALAFLAGCAATTDANVSAPSPAASSALVTPTPASMTPRPMHSCAQPGQGVQFVDARTGAPIDLRVERIVATLPTLMPPELADSWIVQRMTPPFARRRVVPRVPVIVGAVVLGTHDESTVEILPAGTLADDYVRHIAYIATRAKLAIAAKAAGKALASPAPDDSAREQQYLKTEASDVQSLTLGSPPDDGPFQDDDGDPNASDPHRYLFACKFLESRAYTLILRTLIRKLNGDASYASVKQRLSAERAQDDAIARTGYVPVAYLTLVARNVSPALARYGQLDSAKLFLTQYPFSEVARMTIESAPALPAAHR